jgi:hypothetical protein
MYCPKCGDSMICQEGELTCVWGEMPFSRVVEAVLTTRFAAGSPSQSSEPPFNPQWHGKLRWYCPGCGKPLNRQLECESCDKHLRDLVFDLIELHPHRDRAGGWKG